VLLMDPPVGLRAAAGSAAGRGLGGHQSGEPDDVVVLFASRAPCSEKLFPRAKHTLAPRGHIWRLAAQVERVLHRPVPGAGALGRLAAA